MRVDAREVSDVFAGAEVDLRFGAFAGLVGDFSGDDEGVVAVESSCERVEERDKVVGAERFV